MKRLIVNADDYGFDAEIDAGIIEAHRDGIVTATSCMVNRPRFAEAARVARDLGTLDCGLHLNLTWGAPLAPPERIPRLAPQGRFRSKRGLGLALLAGRIPEAEILAEARAQAVAFRDALGDPSHLDLHQHLHLFGSVYRAALVLARESGIPFLRHPAEPGRGPLYARVVGRAFARRPRPASPPRTTDQFRGLGITGRVDRRALVEVIDTLPPGLSELMVHPGASGTSGTSEAPDRLASSRAAERDALCAPEPRDALERAGVELTTFAAEAG